MNARRFECFCIDPAERLLYAGDISGQISIVDIATFAVVREIQAHFGTIHALAVHPTLPYLAALGNDRTVSLWTVDDRGDLARLAQCSLRDLSCTNDDAPIAPIFSHSVALGFHGTERRLVTRTGNGGTAEIDFDADGGLSLRWSLRLHGDWDVQMTRYVTNGDAVLSAGRDASLVLVEDGRETRRWRFGDVVAHWAEHLDGDTYLIASDLGLVARVDISSDAAPVMGSRFAHDDMEFLTYNKTSGRAFGTSFDRNVYEIDPVTLESLGVVYSPGYKCIWARTLESAPDILLVQSRNGGIYKADLRTGREIQRIKNVPDALWTTIVLPGGDLLAAGEGAHLTHYRLADVDRDSRAQRFEASRIALPMAPESYTKRIVRDPSGMIAFGRTDGDIWVGIWAGTLDRFDRVANLGSAVRDIAVDGTRRRLLAATEDGRIVAVDPGNGACTTLYQDDAQPFPRALWALAYNPVRDLLAFAEFGTRLHIISMHDFAAVAEIECARVKRMRWASADLLLFGSSDEIERFDLRTGMATKVVTQMQNTIEDFIWDGGKRYLLAICYQCTIGLFDFETGARLDHVRDQIDYSKGIAWLDPADTGAYPLDFITWGRSGECHHYRIHNERIVALGPVGTPGAAAGGGCAHATHRGVPVTAGAFE